MTDDSNDAHTDYHFVLTLSWIGPPAVQFTKRGVIRNACGTRAGLLDMIYDDNVQFIRRTHPGLEPLHADPVILYYALEPNPVCSCAQDVPGSRPVVEDSVIASQPPAGPAWEKPPGAGPGGT